MNSKSSPRVVLVDDNDMTRAILRGMLRSHAHCDIVGEASNATQGMELIQRVMPQVVFLDVEMPDMNGLAMLDELRRTLPDIAVLMVTAHSDRETVQAAIRQGASGYVVKPFSAARVLDALAHVVSLREGALTMASGSTTAPAASVPPAEPDPAA